MKNLGRKLLSVVLSLTIVFCCASTTNQSVLAFESDIEYDLHKTQEVLRQCEEKLICNTAKYEALFDRVNKQWNNTLTATEEKLNNAERNILYLKQELDKVKNRLNNCLENEDCRLRLECAEGNQIAC